MTKVTECGKTCLKADTGRMLHHERLDLYTPKAYLFAETEEADWTEVDAADVPVAEELTDAEALAELMEVLNQ